MDNVTRLDLGRIAQDLQIRKIQVEAVVRLLDEGCCIPFITRYRRERTGGLREDVLQDIAERVTAQKQLSERKEVVRKIVQAQGKLTDELHKAINEAEHPLRVEDLYLPFKPQRKKTAAAPAREKGLEPAAQAIWNQDTATIGDLAERIPTLVDPDKQMATPEEVAAQLRLLLAEFLSENADVRDGARRLAWDIGKLCTTKVEGVPDQQAQEFREFFRFSESVRQISLTRAHGMNRGENAKVLNVHLEVDPARLHEVVLNRLQLTDHPYADFIKSAIPECIQHFLLQTLEREIRRDLTDRWEEQTAIIFGRTVRRFLLQPPVSGRVLAINPGIRTGSRVVALDESGQILEHFVLNPPQRRAKKADAKPAVEGTPSETPTQAASPDAAAPTPSTAPIVSADPPVTDGVAPTVPSETSTSVTGESPVTSTVAQASPLSGEVSSCTTESGLVDAPDGQVAPGAQSTPNAQEVAAQPEASDAPPTPTRREDMKNKLTELAQKHNLQHIVIGNGAGAREMEELISELIAERLPNASYIVISDTGSSQYASSGLAREELPNTEAGLRAVVSVGRRFQDPLQELIKIEAQHLGAGLNRYDLPGKRVKEVVERAMQTCVNLVGVDVNTAGPALLAQVAGLNPLLARTLLEHRSALGRFQNREQIRSALQIKESAFTQAAGFLRITGGDNPLDSTPVHPEQYESATKLLSQLGYTANDLLDSGKLIEIKKKLDTLPIDETSKQLSLTPHALIDLLDVLRDARIDIRSEIEPPLLKKGYIKIDQIQMNQELRGTVVNVVDFGVFVDIGLKESGLVHITQLANRYIRTPHDVVTVGEVVPVWVIKLDQERGRVSLTMLKPGTERQPQERRPERERRPPPPRREGPPREGAPPQPRESAPAAGRSERPQGGRGGRHEQQQPSRFQRSLPPRGQTRSNQQEGRRHGGGGPPPATQTPSAEAPTDTQAQRPQQPRGKKDRPLPKLSQAALQGKQALHSFAELKAFMEAKQPEPASPAPEKSSAGTEMPAASANPSTSEASPVESEVVNPASSSD